MREYAIHVAGIIDQAEAQMLVECGVTALGFPFYLPHHKEDLTEEEASKIIRALLGDVTCLVITYLTDTDSIVALCRKLCVSYIQLHGTITVRELSRLKAQWPELSIVKSLVVGAAMLTELEREIEETAPYVDAYITDTYDPSTGAVGATGKTHDWSIDRRIVKISPRPVILAGGLNPVNVREGIQQVHSAGVDVHTGVEGPDGRKDRDLIECFVREARAGFMKIGAREHE